MAGLNANAPLLGTTSPRNADHGGEEEAAADADEGVPEEVDDSEDSQDDKARVSSYFALPRATASGRIAKGVAPTKAVAHTASGQAAKAKAKATGKAAKPKGNKVGVLNPKLKAAGQEPQPTLRFDGRSERLRQGIEEDLQKVGDALKAINFGESFEGLLLTGDALKAFQQELSKKAQLLALQKKAIGLCKGKIGRCTIEGLFADELEACSLSS